MKKTLLIVLITFVIDAKAQFSLLFTQDSASSTNASISGVHAEDQLMIVNFEVSGYQYVNVNRHGKYISIYNMSHALVKTISWASFPVSTSGINNNGFLYFSQLLFNTDNKIEFMYITNPPLYTGIYNEDGILLFSDTAYPAIIPNYALQQYPIYNTPVGTQMILSYSNGQAKVWGLAGTLTTAVDRANHPTNIGLGNAYPNPTANTTTIPYTLPQGTNQAELVFYSTQGTEVKRFKVDGTFSSLLISTSDIPAGTYYYNLQIGGDASATKKMVVIK
jgi:hypothetical protein